MVGQSQNHVRRGNAKKRLSAALFLRKKSNAKNKIIKQKKMFHICYNQNKKGKVMFYD